VYIGKRISNTHLLIRREIQDYKASKEVIWGRKGGRLTIIERGMFKVNWY